MHAQVPDRNPGRYAEQLKTLARSIDARDKVRSYVDVESDVAAVNLFVIRVPVRSRLVPVPSKLTLYNQRHMEHAVRNKIIDISNQFTITDVQTRDYYPGRVWLMGSSIRLVQEAVANCRKALCPRISKPVLVQQDWNEVFTHWRDSSNIEAGQWVRAVRGKYRHDIAYVLAAESNTDIIKVAVIPRIIYYSPSLALLSKEKKKLGLTARPLRKVSKAKNRRPNAELFDASRARHAYPNGLVDLGSSTLHPSLHGILHFEENTIPEGAQHLFRNEFFWHGLTIKNVFGSNFRVTAVPSAQEMIPFLDSRIDPRVEKEFLRRCWRRGDRVNVHAAEHVGDCGIIVDIQEDIDSATISLADTHVSIPITALTRRNEAGDGVRILAGKHRGLRGVVISVEADSSRLIVMEAGSMEHVSQPIDKNHQ